MTALYRLYDNAGSLLYIGIAEHWPTRMKQHAREKPWWDDVADVKLEFVPDRTLAEDVEREAIRTERPLYNVVHAGKAPLPYTTRVCGRLVTYGTIAAFGLRSGKCPIGKVVDFQRTDITVDLFSFATHTYGYNTIRIPTADVAAIKMAKPMSRAEQKRRHGVWSFVGPTPYDIDPLADFQGEWTAP